MRPRTTDNQTPAGRRSRRVSVAVLALAVVSLLSSAAGAAVGQTDAERDRDAIRDRQDALGGEIDLLMATDAEIDAALTAIEDRIAAQQAVVDAADDAAAEAALASQEADLAWARAERDVATLEQAIREMAVASYVRPPTADLVQSLQASSLSDALLQKAYLDARAQRDLGLLGLLETAEREAANRSEEADDAARRAQESAAQAEAELVALRAEQTELDSFAAGLEERINGALAEAAVLADLDAGLSARIAREQAELLARLPPPPPPPPPTTAPPAVRPLADDDESAVSEVDDEADDESTASDDDSGRESEDDDDEDEDDEDAERRRTPPPPLETVQGITVHAGIADDLDALLTAVAADDVSLGGSGYRSTDRQIELRRAHCGPSEYDIWDKPPSQCSPPTARPGTSLHEQGRAIDFTNGGRLITSRSDPGYAWLAEHAADYGLFNLPSEPWHWSTTGS